MARKRKKGDDLVLQALVCGATVEVAANRASISPRTVYRRLEDPQFQRRLREMRADMVQRTSGMLTAAGGESVKTLLALHDPATPPAVRLGAARTTLELSMKMRDSAELEARVAALEARLDASASG